ncbi:MAG: hypothetical protein R2681_12235 [Pyrinomonadaceae bacterium]
MEIFIIGGILVVIMVIVSTTIKKSAAAAYQPETIETEDFRIEKPEGFLYPLRDVPDFPFEAYSNTYGERSTRNIWQARVRLRIFEDSDLEEFVRQIKDGIETVDSEKSLDDLPEGQSGVIIRSRKTDDEVDYRILRKIIETPDHRIFELKTTLLEPYSDDYSDRICEMMRSFLVK